MSDQKRAPVIIDQGTVPPVFVDGLAAIWKVGAVSHLLFTALQPAPDSDAWAEPPAARVVQARLVVPTDQLKVIGRALLDGRVHAAADEAGELVRLQ